jgi:hypothetical protein
VKDVTGAKREAWRMRAHKLKQPVDSEAADSRED